MAMIRSSDERRNALFSDLLGSIRVSSSLFARPELSAPWGFTLADEAAAFHIVTHGGCVLSHAGIAGPIVLAEGDFVVLPRGGTHVLRDSSSTVPVKLDGSLKTRKRDADGIFRAGGGGALTSLVCGNIAFEHVSTDLLLAILPPVIHVRREGSRLSSWLASTLEHVRYELAAGHPASEAVVARIADILFIQAVAMYLEDNADSAESGWLGALRDRQIGPALALMHQHPEQTWTVDSLAETLALSRSAFAARFAQLVGEPPLRYLTRVRLNAAGTRLSTSDETVDTIATSLGYASASSLNKAFRQRFGITPGAYRGRFASQTGV